MVLDGRRVVCLGAVLFAIGCEQLKGRLSATDDAGVTTPNDEAGGAAGSAGTSAASARVTSSATNPTTVTTVTTATTARANATAAAPAKPAGKTAAEIEGAFAACDKTGNGALTGPEATCAPTGADVNKDGVVTKEEFFAAMNGAKPTPTTAPNPTTAPTPTTPPTTAPTPAPAAGGIKLGHYRCSQFVNGRIAPTVGEFDVLSATSYRTTADGQMGQYALGPSNAVTWSSGAFADKSVQSTTWNPQNQHLFMKLSGGRMGSGNWDCWAQ